MGSWVYLQSDHGSFLLVVFTFPVTKFSNAILFCQNVACEGSHDDQKYCCPRLLHSVPPSPYKQFWQILNHGVSLSSVSLRAAVWPQVTETRCAGGRLRLFLLSIWWLGVGRGDCLLTNPLCFCYMHAFHVSAIFALVLAEYFLVWIIGGQGGVSICFPPH